MNKIDKENESKKSDKESQSIKQEMDTLKNVSKFWVGIHQRGIFSQDLFHSTCLAPKGKYSCLNEQNSSKNSIFYTSCATFKWKLVSQKMSNLSKLNLQGVQTLSVKSNLLILPIQSW